jgi:hypothetical protein
MEGRACASSGIRRGAPKPVFGALCAGPQKLAVLVSFNSVWLSGTGRATPETHHQARLAQPGGIAQRAAQSGVICHFFLQWEMAAYSH